MILRAGWVVPVADRPIRDGFVEITGDRITGVGHAAELPEEAAVTSLPSAVLTPGLVNAHTHLELDSYVGLLKPAPLWRWLKDLVTARRAVGQHVRERVAVSAAAWASLREGVTCVGDISRRGDAWVTLQDVPIRKVCFAELLSIADQPPRTIPELEAILEEPLPGALLTAGVSPHAPYTVPAGQVSAALTLAAERGLPWTMHLAETREEVRFLAGEHDAIPFPAALKRELHRVGVESPRMAVADYVRRVLPPNAPGLLAHLNYVEEADARAIADAGHTVVACPRAHAYFGHRDYPLRTLMSAGVPVALGTDSPVCVETLSVLDEARFVRRTMPDPPEPETLLRMITSIPATALGLGDVTGAIRPGLAGDLAAWESDAGALPKWAPEAWLLDQPTRPIAVWVGGRCVYQPSEPTHGPKNN